MRPRFKGIQTLGIALDVVGAGVLALYALVIGPLGVLRGPLVIERFAWYLWVLLPQGLMARSVRTAIDWRLGNFDAAIAQLESLVSTNEEYAKARNGSRVRRRVLEDLYTTLARAYLHAGHIDDAMLVVIRAKKSLGLERLGGLAELDAKTAHLVRAGLAAGRLLDGGGLATMFVKATPTEVKTKTELKPAREPRLPGDGNGTKQESVVAPSATGVPGAKIIPFPPPGQPTVH